MGSRTEVKSLVVCFWVVEQYNLVVSGPVGSPVVGLCVKNRSTTLCPNQKQILAKLHCFSLQYRYKVVVPAFIRSRLLLRSSSAAAMTKRPSIIIMFFYH